MQGSYKPPTGPPTSRKRCVELRDLWRNPAARMEPDWSFYPVVFVIHALRSFTASPPSPTYQARGLTRRAVAQISLSWVSTYLRARSSIWSCISCRVILLAHPLKKVRRVNDSSSCRIDTGRQSIDCSTSADGFNRAFRPIYFQKKMPRPPSVHHPP
jgi:hypothetical protein